jgi:3-deoxy-D-manno-octulosonic-acid transferase
MKKPTIIGPSIFNFKDIILGALKSKAAIQINHIHELPRTISRLSNLETRNSMIQKSKAFISKSEGSSRKALKIISQYF